MINVRDGDNIHPYHVFINDVDSYIGKNLSGHILSEKCKDALEKKQNNENEINGSMHASIDCDIRIIGTTKTSFVKEHDNRLKIIPFQDFDKWIMTCGVIICNIVDSEQQVNEVKKILRVLNKELQDFKGTQIKLIILISSCMTWADTEFDGMDDKTFFNEDMFQSRRPNFYHKKHYNLENWVLKMEKRNPNLLRAIILAPGLIYGDEESVFETFFQSIWNCEKILPIFGSGENILPVIHVLNLSHIIAELIIYGVPATKKYILAVENDSPTLKEIFVTLGNVCGCQKFQYISKKQAMNLPGMTLLTYDTLTVNMKMAPSYVNKSASWPKNNYNFLKNMLHTYLEFKTSRNLHSFKVIVTGPPVSGKTTLSRRLCAQYGLQYISQDNFVKNIIDDLKWKIDIFEKNDQIDKKANDTVLPEVGIYTPYEGETNVIDDFKNELKFFLSGYCNSKDIYIKYLRKTISANGCFNKGWVLDGFPSSYSEYQEVFGNEFCNENYDGSNDSPSNVAIRYERDMTLPDVIITLRAPDTFICERIMSLSEEIAVIEDYTEKNIVRRLEEFRELEDDSLEDFFDESNVYLLNIDITNNEVVDVDSIYQAVVTKDNDISSGYKESRKTTIECGNSSSHMTSYLKNNFVKFSIIKDRSNQWTELLMVLKNEEEQILMTKSDTVRQYMMKNLLPILIESLHEVVLTRPGNPVQFMADHLLKENLSGSRISPGFNDVENFILNRIIYLKKIFNNLW